MRHDDQRIYRTFEEFEREELRRADGFSAYMDHVIGEYAEDLDFEAKASRRRADEDDDE